MTSHTPYTAYNYNDDAFDLSSIFIGRDQQLDLFNIYLNRWKNLMFHADPDETLVTDAPSPNNKIQGLVVLLYGRGGFGKSTLLKHYRDIALQDGQNFTVSKIVDWEFAVEGKRSLFNPPTGREMDAAEYFKALCAQLATALGKEVKAFKEYQAAVRDVEKAQKDASGALEGMRQDDRYGWLRGIALEGITTAIRTCIPPSGVILDNPSVKTATSEVAKMTQDQLSQVHTRLRDKLGARLGDYIDPSLRLGLALGRDLRNFARNFPLLLFFDTYEEVDEGDSLLRLVMGAAGRRVGWVIAGRDNLWAGSDQRERSIAMEYSYKDIVPSDRGLSVNFNAGDVGAFTLSDIQDYFDLLCKGVDADPPLPRVTADGANCILDVTKGVPLAVKIAAGLYLETGSLEAITAQVEGKREIVDQMVRRYLLHTRIELTERTKLYGLAMLRRADQPNAVACALGLTSEQAKSSYTIELSRLQRRYSFIFTEKEEPALHQEVRHFLRLWLLEHRKEPEIVALNEQLQQTHEAALNQREERMHYSTLKERLQDEEWVGIYLDLTEQRFWRDAVEGVRHILPFMIAAAIYARNKNKDAAEIGTFFAANMQSSYRDWWQWADQSLVYLHSRNPSDEELGGLVELEKLVRQQRCPLFPQPVPDVRKELEAALCWRMGEAYQAEENERALAWYEKAFVQIGDEHELREAMAETCYDIGDKLYNEKKYVESIAFSDRAIALKPDYTWAYNNRGNAYSHRQEYERAFADYNHAIALDPNYAVVYNNRGTAYADLKEYERALDDYSHAITLDPNDANAYYNRGLAYDHLKEYQLALADHSHAIALNPNDADAYIGRGFTQLWLKNAQQAIAEYSRSHELDPTNINAAWMAEWASMSKQRVGVKMAESLEKIAVVDPQDYVSFVCRGVALGLRGKLKEGLAEVERAIPLDPEVWDAYFWKGMLCAYHFKGRSQIAVEAIEKALAVELPPVLLTPLYWLEEDRLEFFEQCARPLLERYGV